MGNLIEKYQKAMFGGSHVNKGDEWLREHIQSGGDYGTAYLQASS